MNPKPSIIYTDHDLIVINKPSGIAVHGSTYSASKNILSVSKDGGVSVSGLSVVDFIVSEFPEIKIVGDESQVRPGIVHRLDKDTSGVMVLARNPQSFLLLKNLFQERRVEKVYWAIVCGRPKNSKGIISTTIGRLVKNPLKRGVGFGGSEIRGARQATTEFGVLKYGSNYSLLWVMPKTGRMHQIRVHLKSIGCPVACDRLYGGKKVCCPKGILRQMLHARSISFSLYGGRRFHFEADPPQDFMIALDQIC